MKIRKTGQSAGLIATVIDKLTSSSKTDALSANQGKVLDEKINNCLPLTGGALTGSLESPNFIGKINGSPWEIDVENTTDTWALVVCNGRIQHRVIPTNLLTSDNIYYSTRVTLQVAEAETWYDTGIYGWHLPDGVYIIYIQTINLENQGQWSEKMAGIVAWHNGGTNSRVADEIPLSKAGHASNGHNIRFRILRSSTSEDIQSIRLQVTDNIAWSAEGSFDIYFKKVF